MRLTCPNTHISASYRENHPAITVKCEKTGEFERLAQIIEHLFQPIKKNHVVDYSYSLQGRELDLRIGNQQSQKAISAVQSAKKDLKRFIDNYHERPDDEDDFWKFFRFYINFCTWVVAITLKILFIVTTISIGWLHRRLRKDLGLSSLQATAIISGLIAILMIITFWLTDAHRLFLSESSTTPQPTITSSSPSPQVTNSPSQKPVVSSSSSTKKLPQSLGWIRIGAIRNPRGTYSTGDRLIETTQPVTISPPLIPSISDEVLITNSVNLREYYPLPPNYKLAQKHGTFVPSQKVVILKISAFVDTTVSSSYTVVWAEVGLAD